MPTGDTSPLQPKKGAVLAHARTIQISQPQKSDGCACALNITFNYLIGEPGQTAGMDSRENPPNPHIGQKQCRPFKSAKHIGHNLCSATRPKGTNASHKWGYSSGSSHGHISMSVYVRTCVSTASTPPPWPGMGLNHKM